MRSLSAVDRFHTVTRHTARYHEIYPFKLGAVTYNRFLQYDLFSVSLLCMTWLFRAWNSFPAMFTLLSILCTAFGLLPSAFPLALNSGYQKEKPITPSGQKFAVKRK